MATGIAIMAAAARNLTRVNLELGGNAPAIVLNDADFVLTANALFNSRALDTGQVCNAAERVYPQRGIAAPLADRVTRLMAETRYRQPADRRRPAHGPDHQPGRPRQDRRAGGRWDAARKQGAQVLTGGCVADRPGFHDEPTVLMGCTDPMDVMSK